jgi:alkanesulfonate monooxygenase SsuD/methylene tetrahydromethanopterin reductase-like flavin-dependent oxidoreductase (luciferase family)
VEGGIVRRVGVVPKPLQQPHPPIFQPFASSERTIRWCAHEGVTAILPPLHPTLEAELFRVYAEASGRALGDGVGVLRDVVVADTDDQAMAIWANSGVFCGATWFAPFGFTQGLADPVTGEAPDANDLLAGGLALVGSVDTVTRQLASLLERLPARWLFAWTYNALIPHAALMRSIDSFATTVLPRVADLRATPRSESAG